MEQTFCGETTNFLRSNLSSAENISCDAVSFRRGSVIGDLEITLLASSQSLADSLSSSVAGLNLENANLGSLYVISFSVDNRDSCQSDTCRNGGTCTDGFNDFSCACAEDYSGKDCSTYRDSCQSDTCRNGGTCTDGFNDFSCACAEDYSGKDCSTYNGSGGLLKGAKIGIVLGSVAGVLLIVVIIVCVVMVKKNKKSGRGNKAMVTGSRNRVGPSSRQSEEWQTEDQVMLAIEDRRYQGNRKSPESVGVNNSANDVVSETKQ
ncbi:neurogenic locus notch homolog protein 1-like [Lytechinus variegatus]|uniref:neurogenic locus notch homolog protein 1-like n=1 Tax=Lytechinus variegatus TaxID=7654 RepID=UPI001BB23AB2|nr:neurogenic locus notch homolog protein 1-like [Lytechinus variegatus]